MLMFCYDNHNIIICDVNLHLLMPTFEAPANHGSSIKMHRKVLALISPSRKLGLS